MNKAKNEELAARYSWQEILEPLGFEISHEEFEEHPSGMGGVTIRTWREKHSGTILRTFDEFPILYPSEGLELGTSKWEVIRRAHFVGNTQIASDFLEAGGGFSPNLLDVVADIRRDVLDEQTGHLPVSERYYYDPLLKGLVDKQVTALEAQLEAARRFSEAQYEQEGPTPPGVCLADFLEQDLEGESFRIEGLVSSGSTSTLVGARKAGKTTLTYNLIRSLVSGEPFLGAFEASKVRGKVGYVNMELTDKQSQVWFERACISDPSKVHLWNLRGQPNPFRSDLSAAKFAEEVASQEIEVLILDPFSGVFAGANKDAMNNEQVKEFMLKLERFKVQASVSELVILVHAGWNQSRSRGASALEDHPDTIMKVEVAKDGTRWFSAIGRDVEVAEGPLTFDKEKMSLTLNTKSRKEQASALIEQRILTALNHSPSLNANDLQEEVGGSKGLVIKARRSLVKTGQIIETKGARGELFFSLYDARERADSGPALDDAPAFKGGAAASRTVKEDDSDSKH